MRAFHFGNRSGRVLGRWGLGIAVLTSTLLGGTRATQDAVANGDTRTITVLHEHTKENATITFKRDGRYDSGALDQLNWLLRDWRLDEPTKMDPRLFDIVWEVYRSVDASEPIHVVSAYRSPKTNAMLRRRSRAVSEFSQHMRGKAMDFYLPGVPVERIRGIGMRLQHGGVGYYPNAFNPFIHLDAGSVRSWPRMSRDQLARIFPDGKTVHVPADGKPLAGYEEAKAEILARGGSVLGYAIADAGEGGGESSGGRSFWAKLFGGGEDEDAEYIRATQARGRATASASPRAPTQVAFASSSNSDDGGSRGLLAYAPSPEDNRSLVRGGLRQTLIQVASATGELPQSVAAPQDPSSSRLSSADLIGSRLFSNPAGTATTTPGPDEGSAEAVIIPVPPRRPDDIAALALAFAPTPPARPVEFAVASLGPVSVAPTAMLRASSAAVPDERAQLRALFASASGTAPTAQARLATSRATPQGEPPAGMVAERSSGLAVTFSAAASPDMAAARFTGSAVKPLPVLR